MEGKVNLRKSSKREGRRKCMCRRPRALVIEKLIGTHNLLSADKVLDLGNS